MSKPQIQKVKHLKDEIIHSDNWFFTLVRSGASSQLCGWIDMIVSFVLFAFCNMTPWMSTATGAFVGGVCNYIINMRFTFHARNLEPRASVTKFVFVWIGSLLLNSFGTQIAYYLVRDWKWLIDETGFSDDAVFLGARLFVSLVVSLGWNFVLQRNFVFRDTRFDRHILRVLDVMGIRDGLLKHKEKANADKEK